MNLNLQPRNKKPLPGQVNRWFVYNQQGEIFDGPFQTKALAEKAAEKFRDWYGEEPFLKQESTRPVATNFSDPKMDNESYW